MRSRRAFIGLAGLTLILGVACSGSDDPSPSKPEIVSFQSSAASVHAGDAVELQWKSRHATKVALRAGDAVVDLGGATAVDGSVEVTVSKSTVFTLTVSGKGGEASESLAVEVIGDPPSILSFSASPESIAAGESSTLSWRTEAADSLSLTAIPGGVVELGGANVAEGSLTVSPSETTRYVLVAHGADGDVEAQVEVRLIGHPTVAFEANPELVVFGGTATLSWATTDASRLTISSPDEVLVDADDRPTGSLEVSPEALTTYTLEAEGPGGSTTATVAVAVQPRIDGFEAVFDGEIRVGMPVELHWSVRGAQSLTLGDGVGAPVVVPAGSRDDGEMLLPVGPGGRFILTARNGDEEVVREIEVQLTELPVIIAFEATPELATADADHPAAIQVGWTVEGATALELVATPGGTTDLGSSPDSGLLGLWVTETTVLRLVAENGQGQVSRELVVEVDGLPSIATFVATPSRVAAGESVEIAWDAINAAVVRLERDGVDLGVDPAAVQGQYVEALAAEASYRLFVENAVGGQVESEPLVVTVGAPIVASFVVSPDQASPGTDLELSWQNIGGTSLQVLTQGGDEVCVSIDLATIREGSCVAPMPALADDLELTLVVTNSDGSDSRTAVVVNTSGPVIQSFTADPVQLEAGNPVELRWAIDNDVDGRIPVLALSDDHGTTYDISLVHPNQGRVSFQMNTPGQYLFTLQATTPGTKAATATASVVVEIIPEILSFTATPEEAASETDPVLLEWTTANAHTLRIFQVTEDGEVVDTVPLVETSVQANADAGSIVAQPTVAAPNFRIDLVNAAGTVVSRILRVGITRADVLSFTATSQTLLRGESTTLEWTTAGADRVSLQARQEWVETDDPYIDVSGSPTALPFSTGSVQSGSCAKLNFPDGFTFNWDGAPRAFANICHPGLVHFDGFFTSATTFNSALPTSASNEHFALAPFWGDLSFTSQGGELWYDLIESGGERALVIQYKNYSHKSALDAQLNFEVVLWQDGAFDYRYGLMHDPGGSEYADGLKATIGYQRNLGTDAVQVLHDTPYPGGLSWRTFHFPILPLTLEPLPIAGGFVDIAGAPDAELLTFQSQGNFGYGKLDFPVGFEFPYMGQQQTSAYVFSSGFFSFVTSPTGRPTNTELLLGAGSAGFSGDARYVHIAPLWQSLTNTNSNNDGAGGQVWTSLRTDSEGPYLIVQWAGFSGQGVTDSELSFQLVLRGTDGTIEFHYGPMSSPTTPGVVDGSLATVGYQDAKGIKGYQQSFKTAVPGGLSGTGWRFPPTPFVPLNGSMEVRPRATVDYELVASNPTSHHQAELLVEVFAPVWLAASIEPAYPAPTEPFSIAWQASGAQALRIADSSGQTLYWALPDELDAGHGSFTVSAGLPLGTFEYLVWATGIVGGDEAEETLIVEIAPPFSLDAFDAAVDRIKLGESVQLSWASTNATTVTLETADGVALPGAPFATSGTLSVSPTQTETYRLVVESGSRQLSAELTVEVRQAWVDSVEITSSTYAGGSATLSWDSTGGQATFRGAEVVEDVTSSRPFVDISGESASVVVTPNSVTGNTSVTLPFPFPVEGASAPKMAMRVMPRGFAALNTSDSGSTAKAAFPAGTTADRGRFGVFWDTATQLNGPAGTTPGEMRTLHVENTTGPDAFIVQWKDLKLGSSATSARGSLNFQLVLFEDGSFEYRYGAMAPGDSVNPATAATITQALGGSASVGYQTATVGQGHQLSYNKAFPGGLENRSFRFRGPIAASGQLDVMVTASTAFELCVEADGYEECSTVRVVVPTAGDLMFTELSMVPMDIASSEWFEIRNLSPDPIDLAGMILRSGPDSHVVAPPGGSMIVPSGAYASFALSATVPFVADYVLGVGLDPYTNQELVLDYGPITMARAAWDSTWFTDPGESRSLDPARQIRSVVENPSLADWCLDNVNYIPGSVEFGTPGAHGSTCLQSYYEVDYVSGLPFIDISETGTRMGAIAASFGYDEVPGGLGFDFPFFGDVIASDQELWAAVNGVVSFGYFGASKGTSLGSNAPLLPQTKVNNHGLVVGYWDDLRPQTGTHFEYERRMLDGRQLMIFQWNGYSYNALTGSITFQIQLWEDGDIVVAYQELTGSTVRYQGDKATVGLEAVGGGRAIQGFYQKPILFEGQSVLFRIK